MIFCIEDLQKLNNQIQRNWVVIFGTELAIKVNMIKPLKQFDNPFWVQLEGQFLHRLRGQVRKQLQEKLDTRLTEELGLQSKDLIINLWVVLIHCFGNKT